MFLLHILQSPGQEPESFCTLHIVSKTGHVWKRRVLLNSLIGPELTLFGNKFSDSSDIGFFCDQAAVDPQALVSSLPQVVKGHVAIVAFLAEERQQVETSDMYQSLAEVAVHKKPDRDSTVIATLLPHSQVKFLEEVELDSNTSMALVEAGGNHGFVLWRALGEPSCFFKTFPEILADALPDALPQEQEGGRSFLQGLRRRTRSLTKNWVSKPMTLICRSHKLIWTPSMRCCLTWSLLGSPLTTLLRGLGKFQRPSQSRSLRERKESMVTHRLLQGLLPQEGSLRVGLT